MKFLKNIYFLNKIISFWIVWTLIWWSYLFAQSEEYAYYFIVLLFIITAYSHYIISFIYQTLYFKRILPLSRFIFILITMWFVLFLWWHLSVYIFYFFLFVYIFFMIHAYLNEKMFYNNYINKKVSFWYIEIISLVLLLLSIKSFLHPSIVSFLKPIYLFFNKSIETTYLSPFLTNINLLYLINNLILVIIIIIFIILWFIFNTIIKEKKYINALILLILGIWWIIFLYFSKPLSFIYLNISIITYHVTSWTIYSHQKLYTLSTIKKNRKNRQLIYINLWIHLLFLIMFLHMYFFPNNIFMYIYINIFSTEPYFIFLTFFHITTSFFNEKPILKLFGAKLY